MAGSLILVPTPIGNLGDISPRASEVLAQADFIAAEDTRVTLRLLNHLGLKKCLVSYHEHNKLKSGPQILRRISDGETCALVTDAGTPAISDPGEDLVRMCAEAGITVTAIPGPCAAITALAVSGLPTDRFTFEGFLPSQKKQRRARLAAIALEEKTMILYEAPHRLLATLEELTEAMGPDRRITLCRELTKLHEEVIRTTLGQAAAHYGTSQPRGEFVLILAGAPAREPAQVSREDCMEEIRRLRREGASLKDAVRQVSRDLGIPRNALYEEALSLGL